MNSRGFVKRAWYWMLNSMGVATVAQIDELKLQYEDYVQNQHRRHNEHTRLLSTHVASMNRTTKALQDEQQQQVVNVYAKIATARRNGRDLHSKLQPQIVDLRNQIARLCRLVDALQVEHDQDTQRLKRRVAAHKGAKTKRAKANGKPVR